MVLKHRPFKVLHGVGLLIDIRNFLELATDWQALPEEFRRVRSSR